MNDIGTRIYEDNGEYEVWIGPASDLRDGNIINAFIVGIGSTRDEAVENAVRELESVTDALQAPFCSETR